jgi:Mg-chelatase subunit ChlD
MGLLRRAADCDAARRITEREGYRLGDHKAVKLRLLTDAAQRGVRVALVTSHVSAADAEVAGMRALDGVEPALAWLVANVAGPLERGLIIEDAGFATVAPDESRRSSGHAPGGDQPDAGEAP